MSNILRGIQQALEAIRIEIEKADWQLRLEILQPMLSKSTSVVAGVRKWAAPKRSSYSRQYLHQEKSG